MDSLEFEIINKFEELVANIGELYQSSQTSVEGIKKKTSSDDFELFVGQYDIKAAPVEEPHFLSSVSNVKGIIHEIRIYEGNDYTRDYSKFSSKSYETREIDKVNKMITKIKEEHQIIEEAKRSGWNKKSFKS